MDYARYWDWGSLVELAPGALEACASELHCAVFGDVLQL